MFHLLKTTGFLPPRFSRSRTHYYRDRPILYEYEYPGHLDSHNHRLAEHFIEEHYRYPSSVNNHRKHTLILELENIQEELKKCDRDNDMLNEELRGTLDRFKKLKNE